MRLFAITLAAFLFGHNPAISAQVVEGRSSHLGLGASVGYMSASVPQHGDGFVGGSLNIQGGLAVSSQILVGLEFDGFVVGYEGGMATLALVGSYYPHKDGDFFIKLGVAPRYLLFTCAEHSAADIAALVGVGVDLRRSGTSFIRPFVQLVTSVAELESLGGTQMGTLVQAGLSFSMFTH